MAGFRRLLPRLPRLAAAVALAGGAAAVGAHVVAPPAPTLTLPGARAAAAATTWSPLTELELAYALDAPIVNILYRPNSDGVEAIARRLYPGSVAVLDAKEFIREPWWTCGKSYINMPLLLDHIATAFGTTVSPCVRKPSELLPRSPAGTPMSKSVYSVILVRNADTLRLLPRRDVKKVLYWVAQDAAEHGNYTLVLCVGDRALARDLVTINGGAKIRVVGGNDLLDG